MERLVRGAMRARGRVLAVTLALLVVMAWFARALTLDALPDVTTNQVLVLTRAPGLTPEEVERLISRPVEAALGGAPGLVQQRSLSRFGISAVTAVFGDDVDPYRARQAVQERLQRVTATLPEGAEAPELGPLSGGLGEVYQVALRSPTRTQAELLELATLRVEPLLRAIPGVVEVNPWGGAARALDVTALVVTRGALEATLRREPSDLDAASLGALGALVRALARQTGTPLTPQYPNGDAARRHARRVREAAHLGSLLQQFQRAAAHVMRSAHHRSAAFALRLAQPWRRATTPRAPACPGLA